MAESLVPRDHRYQIVEDEKGTPDLLKGHLLNRLQVEPDYLSLEKELVAVLRLQLKSGDARERESAVRSATALIGNKRNPDLELVKLWTSHHFANFAPAHKRELHMSPEEIEAMEKDYKRLRKTTEKLKEKP